MRKSPVWKFYERILENRRCVAVECKLCARTFKFFGNTTNLKVHLTSRHPIQWELSENGTLDETSAIQFEDESSLLADTSTKRKYKHVSYSISVNKANYQEGNASDEMPTINIQRVIDKSDTELQNDDDEADLAQLTSNEEWLEDNPFQDLEYEQPKRQKVRTIKREVESPKHYNYVYNTKRKSSVPPVIRTLNNKPPETPKDEYSVFGEYIASKLRKIQLARARGNIQQLITTILWQAEYGKYNDSGSVKNIIRFMNEDPEPVSNEIGMDCLNIQQNQSVED